MASVVGVGSGSACCGGVCRSSSRDCRAITRVPVPSGWTLAPGDRVLLEIPASGLLVGLAAAWGIPVVGLLAGAVAGALIPTALGLPGWQGWEVAGAGVGLVVSALVQRRLERTLQDDSRFRPRLARHLSRQDGNRPSFESTD